MPCQWFRVFISTFFFLFGREFKEKNTSSFGTCIRSEYFSCPLCCIIVADEANLPKKKRSYDRVEPSGKEMKMRATEMWWKIMNNVTMVLLIWLCILMWNVGLMKKICFDFSVFTPTTIAAAATDTISPWSQYNIPKPLTPQKNTHKQIRYCTAVADDAICSVFPQIPSVRRCFSTFSEEHGVTIHDRRKSNLKCKWFSNRLMASIQHATFLSLFSLHLMRLSWRDGWRHWNRWWRKDRKGELLNCGNAPVFFPVYFANAINLMIFAREIWPSSLKRQNP